MSAVLVDGKQLAAEIRQQLKAASVAHGKPVALGIVMAGADLATQQFVRMKRRAAEEVGIQFEMREFPSQTDTETLISAVRELAQTVQGIVVQLPLPSSVDTAAVLAAVPPDKDVDVLSDAAWKRFEQNEPGALVPPVSAAIEAILKHYHVGLQKSHMVIVGSGKLVGRPCEILFKRYAIQPRVLNVMTPPQEARAEIAAADIIISGAGSPKMITPDMIKVGAVLIDAGTSESNGAIVGDIDPACAEKALIFTPTPGGVGPVAVAMLLKNVVHAQ